VEYELKDKLNGHIPPTPFEFLLINCYNNKQFEILTKMAFNFFIREEVTFVYENKEIIIGDYSPKDSQTED
jgi:hypothetical protein